MTYNRLAWRSAPIGLVRVVSVGIGLSELRDQRVGVGRGDVPADNPVDQTCYKTHLSRWPAASGLPRGIPPDPRSYVDRVTRRRRPRVVTSSYGRWETGQPPPAMKLSRTLSAPTPT